MSDQRVLILSSKFGEGHYKAGEALTNAFLSQLSPKVTVSHLDFGSFFFKKTDYLMRVAYLNLVKKTPEIWRLLYEKTTDLSLDSFGKLFYGRGSEDLLKYIRKFDPDIIVNTHFIPAGRLAEFKRLGQINVPIVTVITDYLAHGVWIHPGVDLYVVGCRDVHTRLMEAGVMPDKVTIAGIPVRGCFEKHLAKQDARQKLGLVPDIKTVMVMRGSCGSASGVTEILEILECLKECVTVQFLFVCGSDQDAYNILSEKTKRLAIKAEVFGYIDYIQDLMAASDLLITKGGALTISEALTVGLPLLMYKPIPGHENGNASFVESGGAGIKVTSPQILCRWVTKLLTDEGKLTEMSLAAHKLSPPNSADMAAQAISKIARMNISGEYKTEAIV